MPDESDRSRFAHFCEEVVQELGIVYGGRAVEMLVERFGGEKIHVPTAARLESEKQARLIRGASARGYSVAQIAASLRITERTVRRKLGESGNGGDSEG